MDLVRSLHVVLDRELVDVRVSRELGEVETIQVVDGDGMVVVIRLADGGAM
jgi:hypothetical protein